jgi:DNA primase
MEISLIKQKLSLSQVLQIYLIKVDKNGMALCPFHNDTKPSLQVNLSKNYYKCHACGKKGDQIQFVQDYGNLTKREALLKCVQLIDETPFLEKPIKPIQITKPMNNKERNQFLEKLYETFIKSVYLSAPAKDYLKQRNLHHLLEKRGQVGFNSGQFHHAGRFENETNPEEAKKQMINEALEYGLLLESNLTAKTGEKAYYVFGNKSLAYALRNEFNEVVGFYFRSIDTTKTAKHFYLKNRQGLYPKYPDQATKKLILTESIIDCSSLLQINEIIENYSLLACYGTNGLTEEHLTCIKHLPFLEEIIFIFDNDTPGIEAVKKYTPELKKLYPKLTITTVETPNKDINETLQGHESEIFTELLQQRKTVNFSYSIEDLTQKLSKIEDLDNIEITEGENLREKIANTRQPKAMSLPDAGQTQEPILFLKASQLLQRLNTIIGTAGIVGEENSRLLLFLIVISYMNKSPIHGIVQGSSGSGKTHAIKIIVDMMPQEDVLKFTRITESSLYNYGEFELFRKIIVIEDLDGLKEDALYALRELISNQSLSSLTSIKDKKGNSKGTRKEVKGQFSSLSATTKGELYEDNMNRSFIIAVDESEAQTQRIIDYQNKRITGEIDPKQEKKAIAFIAQLVRNLKNYEVQNSFASKIQLPNNVRNKRRLNEMFQSVIKQITILNQYQRQLTKDGKLITTIEDIENAIEILFESVVLKADELDGSLRQFFEKLKGAFKEEQFTRFDAMEVTGLKKSQLQVYLNELIKYEYIKQLGFANKGYKYKIGHFDNNKLIRSQIKEHFKKQIEQLKKDAKKGKTDTSEDKTDTSGN